MVYAFTWCGGVRCRRCRGGAVPSTGAPRPLRREERSGRIAHDGYAQVISRQRGAAALDFLRGGLRKGRRLPDEWGAPSDSGGLAVYVPGFFFEGCLILGAPERLRPLPAKASVDRSTEIFLAFLCSFVVGSTFVLLVRLLHVFSRVLVQRLMGLWLNILEHRLVPSADAREADLLKKATPDGRPQRSAYVRIVRKIWATEKNKRARRDRVQEAWSLVAAALLGRYGVKPDKLGIWTSALGSFRDEQVKGETFTVALHASGWAGLAAMYYVPELRIASLHDLCSLLVLVGFLHCLSTGWWSTGRRSWIVGLRNTWRELKNLGPIDSPTVRSDGEVPESD